MSDLPLHPAIVHVPLGLAIAIPFLAAAVALAIWRGRLPRAALALVAGAQLLLAAGAFAAMELGEREKPLAAQAAPRNAIQDHEEAAELFVWSSLGVLALSLAAVFAPTRWAAPAAAVVAAASVVVAALALDAGRKGGELVFRYGARVQTDAAQPGPPPSSPAARD